MVKIKTTAVTLKVLVVRRTQTVSSKHTLLQTTGRAVKRRSTFYDIVCNPPVVAVSTLCMACTLWCAVFLVLVKVEDVSHSCAKSQSCRAGQYLHNPEGRAGQLPVSTAS